ncbi:hypothetical protein Tco_1160864 [Tanacetum coccineum]
MGENVLYFARIVLLNKVRGATDWTDFREFDKVVYPTFKDACYAHGLLEDDKEYIDGLLEASHWGIRNYLRRFFVMLIMTDSMSWLEFVYEKTWHVMATDVESIEGVKKNDPGYSKGMPAHRIAITGESIFTTSAMVTDLIKNNILRIGKVNVIGNVILFLGKLCVTNG